MYRIKNLTIDSSYNGEIFTYAVFFGNDDQEVMTLISSSDDKIELIKENINKTPDSIVLKGFTYNASIEGNRIICGCENKEIPSLAFYNVRLSKSGDLSEKNIFTCDIEDSNLHIKDFEISFNENVSLNLNESYTIVINTYRVALNILKI